MRCPVDSFDDFNVEIVRLFGPRQLFKLRYYPSDTPVALANERDLNLVKLNGYVVHLLEPEEATPPKRTLEEGAACCTRLSPHALFFLFLMCISALRIFMVLICS